jgi:(+)-trans-carveol dehydrogenase
MTAVGAARYAGSRVSRVEDARLLTGAGTFVDDIVRPGMLPACFVRSPHPRAKIIAIDVTAALEQQRPAARPGRAPGPGGLRHLGDRGSAGAADGMLTTTQETEQTQGPRLAMPGRAEGKVAFITGAGRGQGRSHAVRLAQEGADIIAIDICHDVDGALPTATPADLAETVKLVEAQHRRIIATQADVRDFDAVKAAIDGGVAELGRLDIVVANAGIASIGGPVESMAAGNWKDTIDINLTGLWHTARAAVPHLIAGGRGGSIVLTSSVGGMHALPNMSHYVSAKHGVVGLMRSLAVELGQHGIRVNSVHPTNVNTPMFMNEGTYRLFRPDVENPGPDDVAPIAQMMHVLPIGWVEPEDISNAIVFLSSDEARYITGVTLPVDGGALLK